MALSFKGLYRFEEFELNPSGRAFLRNGKPVLISPKAFEVLTYLVINPGRVVTKEELLQAVWPDSFVEESNLAQHISWLRKALGDRSNFIVTVPGRGYQFTAQVQAQSPPESFPEAQSGDILVQRVRERTHVVIEESSPAPLPAKATRVSGRIWPYTLVTAGVLALAIWAGWKWSRRTAAGEYHKIVVADFINTTGDTTFDGTLKRALEIDLAQSPYVDVMSEREAVSTLQLMGRKGDAAITSEVAREVCERSNRHVLLTGNIASVGSEYLVTLEAADCNSGKDLASAEERAAAKEKVLSALDAVTDRVRTGLGESAKSVESYQVPIAQATTPSLDALKSYSLGVSMEAQGKEPAETLPFYQRAAELDPQFAMAYVMMAVEYYNLGEYNQAAEDFKKAFDLSDRVSAWEKFTIQAHYYAHGQKDLEQGIKTYRLWAATYPHDWAPWVNMANDLTQLGQYAPAIAAGERAMQVDPDRGVSYIVLARACKRGNRFADAKSVGLEAVRRGKDSSALHAILFEVAFAEQDQDALQRETKWEKSNGGGWYFVDEEASAMVTAGKLREAEELYHQAYETAERANLPEAADEVLIDQALTEFSFGLPAASRATLRRVRKLDTDSSDVAMLLARLGDTTVAEHYLAEHNNETHDTRMTYAYLPLVRAMLAEVKRKPLEAVAALEPAIPYELADYSVLTERGEAYLQARKGEMAADQYKKILANPGVNPVSCDYPLAHLGLARAYAQENNKTESRNEYEKFFALWKDADADVPVLKQARMEYAHLR